jgi:hypothetical protein
LLLALLNRVADETETKQLEKQTQHGLSTDRIDEGKKRKMYNEAFFSRFI